MAFTERNEKMATDATAIIAIPEALLETAATRHFEGTLDLAELAAGPDTYTFAAPVSWSVEATNTFESHPHPGHGRR